MTAAGARPGLRPLVVLLLIVLNVAVFVWTVSGSVSSSPVLESYASPQFAALALVPYFVADEWWRPLTAGFLHVGLPHLLIDMLGLYVLGRYLEPVLGRVRFLAVYLVALLGGSAAVVLFDVVPEVAPLVTPFGGFGVAVASGPVCGVLGGLFVVSVRQLRPLGRGWMSTVFLYYLLISLFGLLPGTSTFALVGGLVVGTAATAGLLFAPVRNRVAVQVAVLGGLAALVVLTIWVRTAALS